MADTQTSRVFGAHLQGTPQIFELAENLRAQRALSPVHLLVVDDDEQVREVCGAVAEECGLKVVDVGTGEEALEVMEISSVDILLTDLRLPGTSGLDLLRKVTVTHPDIAVVMLTQYGTSLSSQWTVPH
jgi:DNA-binding NtrC family response regulator